MNCARGEAISEGHRRNRSWAREHPGERDEAWFSREIAPKLDALTLARLRQPRAYRSRPARAYGAVPRCRIRGIGSRYSCWLNSSWRPSAHVESRSAVKAAACPVVLALIIVFVEPSRSSAAPTSSPRAGCQIKGDLISGRGLGTPPPSFIRVTSKDGSLNEILPLPSVQSDMIQTESLIRGPSNGDEWVDVNCAAVNPVDAYGNVALSRDPCDYRNYTIVDNGPKATFAGAARSGSAAVIRVKVVQEKFFTSGIFTLDDWVGFSVNGSPEVALPAKGVEPVYVTAYFPYLKPGRHYVAITVFEGFIDEGAPAGTVCL